MKKDQKLSINIISSMVAYFVTLLIQFFLSPYIVENIGLEANGFVSLANDFVNYASLVTIAINSLAGRFITIKIYEKDINSANIYFSSVFFVNIILSIIMSIVMVAIIYFLEYLINVPEGIILDVKILFGFVFANFIINTIGTTYSVSTFVTNRLYLTSLRQMEANIIRAFIVLGLFSFFEPKIYYIGIASVMMGVYIVSFSIYYTKKLLPQFCIKLELLDIKAIWSIFSSGIWNLITRLGQLLLDGLDLLITNIFINATSMGVLAIAKMLSMAITGIVGNAANVFSPDFTILYAEKKETELVRAVFKSMKIMGILSNIPIVVLIVCGERFFALWQPTQNSLTLHRLAVLSCGCLIFSGSVNCLYNIFTVVNKLKFNSLTIVLSGIINTVLVCVFLPRTDGNIYVVAGISTLISIVRNLLFTVPYGAICLGKKWHTFYPVVAKSVVYVLICSLIGASIERVWGMNGWLDLITLTFVVCFVSGVISLFTILNYNDREELKIIFTRRFVK